jgi:hypothetical protein
MSSHVGRRIATDLVVSVVMEFCLRGGKEEGEVEIGVCMDGR